MLVSLVFSQELKEISLDLDIIQILFKSQHHNIKNYILQIHILFST